MIKNRDGTELFNTAVDFCKEFLNNVFPENMDIVMEGGTKKDEKIKDDLLQPSVEIIKYIFEKHNLAYTTKSIEKMIIINENKNIYLQLFNNGIKKSEFYVPRNDVKQYYIENEHGFYKEILAEHI